MKIFTYYNIFKRSIPKIFCKKKVDFIICGTQKGGTTALYSYMSEHPEISMAIKKEVHFFDYDALFFFNYSFYPIYHSFYDFKQRNKIFGEATPIYMYWEKSPKRMWCYNPDLKLIIILRNPVERAFSQWNMARVNGVEKNTFIKALKNENSNRQKNGKLQNRKSYIGRGFYTEQIERIWQYFPKEQTLILKTENLLENPTYTLNRIYNFLQLDNVDKVKKIFTHSYEYKYKMTQTEKEFLLNIYRKEIKQLEKLLNWDCTDWLSI